MSGLKLRCAVRWTEVEAGQGENEDAPVLGHCRYFDSLEERDAFADKLIERDEFRRFVAWIDENGTEHTTNV